MEFPLSRDEHAAMARYLGGIRKQLQDVSDLFKKRYGKSSEIADEATKSLASVSRLEYHFLHLENSPENQLTAQVEAESVLLSKAS